MLSDDEKCILFRKLVKDEEFLVRMGIAQNKIPSDCACEIAEILSNDKELSVRYMLASHQQPPKECACEIMNKLSADNDADVRRRVALTQTNLPEECACMIMTKLANDDDFYVIHTVASQRYLPKACACDILLKLADDDDNKIRYAAKKNNTFSGCNHAQ